MKISHQRIKKKRIVEKTSVNIVGIVKRRERRKERGFFEEIRSKNSNLRKAMDIKIHEVQKFTEEF